MIEPEAYLDPERPAPVEITLDDVKLNGVAPFLDDRLGKFVCATALRTYNNDEDAGMGTRGQAGWPGAQITQCFFRSPKNLQPTPPNS